MLPAGSSKALQRHSALAAGMLGGRWVPQLLSMASLGGRGVTRCLQTGAPSKSMLLPARCVELSKDGVCPWK